MPAESQNINLLTKKWRAITYDYPTLATYSDVSRLYCLTDFQVAWLMSNLDYYAWSTRWTDNNATTQELLQQRAELEYRLMSCIDLQTYMIEYGYEREVAKELEVFDALYDVGGIPDLNPNTPTDFFSGDDSTDRLEALCSACNIYVRTYSANWIQKAQVVLGIVAVVGILASISIVGGVIASVLVGGLAFITSTALTAMQDNDALDDVVCCMYESLKGSTVNQSNFTDSLDSCGFDVGSNEAIIRDIIASDLGQFDNYLSFLNSLGDSYVLSQIGVSSCPCDIGWVYESAFDVDADGWTAVEVDAPYDDPQALYDNPVWDSQDVEKSEDSWVRVVNIFRDIDSTFIENITYHYDITKGTFPSGSTTALQINASLDGGGNSIKNVGNSSISNGEGDMSYDVNDDVVSIRLLARSSFVIQASPVFSGFIELQSITITGTGVNPFI